MTAELAPIHQAAYIGDVHWLNQIVEEAEKERDDNTNTNKNIMIQTLVNQPNETHDAWRPIHYAASYGKLGAVKFLVEKGALIDAREKAGRQALHQASLGGYWNVVEYLMEQRPDADVNAQDDSGDTPLHGACANGHLEVVQYLVRHGADVECRRKNGDTPLHQAIHFGHLAVTQFLVNQANSNVNAKNNNGQNALHLALIGGNAIARKPEHWQILCFLLKRQLLLCDDNTIWLPLLVFGALGLCLAIFLGGDVLAVPVDHGVHHHIP